MAESMIAWPLDGHLPVGRHGAGSGEAPLTLTELRPGSIVEVGCWPDTLNRMRIVLPQLGRDATLMELAPGRWWLVSQEPGLAQELERQADRDSGLVRSTRNNLFESMILGLKTAIKLEALIGFSSKYPRA